MHAHGRVIKIALIFHVGHVHIELSQELILFVVFSGPRRDPISEENYKLESASATNDACGCVAILLVSFSSIAAACGMNAMGALIFHGPSGRLFLLLILLSFTGIFCCIGVCFWVLYRCCHALLRKACFTIFATILLFTAGRSRNALRWGTSSSA